MLPLARSWTESRSAELLPGASQADYQPTAQNGSASQMGWPQVTLGSPSRFLIAILGNNLYIDFLLFTPFLTPPDELQQLIWDGLVDICVQVWLDLAVFSCNLTRGSMLDINSVMKLPQTFYHNDLLISPDFDWLQQPRSMKMPRIMTNVSLLPPTTTTLLQQGLKTVCCPGIFFFSFSLLLIIHLILLFPFLGR